MACRFEGGYSVPYCLVRPAREGFFLPVLSFREDLVVISKQLAGVFCLEIVCRDVFSASGVFLGCFSLLFLVVRTFLLS